jgi:glyoxylase-like metal-dependent hydrolase (beta-lactamase superfamily II)
MILEQYYLGCLSQASYLIGDERTGVAAVVDPRRDVDDYLADAARFGLEIKHVILTHFHADFVAGHLELHQRTGARIHLGPGAQAEYEFHSFADGELLEFGDVRLRVLHTPGHTPESISILVYDLATDPTRPRAVLTGDTLFVGDVGRPDLLASARVPAETLARMLYRSLHDKLLPLPDETLLFPGHGAGSACGKHLGAETISSIGEQRRGNYALQPMNEAEFVGLVTADQPEAPAYFSRDAELNRRWRPLLEETLRVECCGRSPWRPS